MIPKSAEKDDQLEEVVDAVNGEESAANGETAQEAKKIKLAAEARKRKQEQDKTKYVAKVFEKPQVIKKPKIDTQSADNKSAAKKQKKAPIETQKVAADQKKAPIESKKVTADQKKVSIETKKVTADQNKAKRVAAHQKKTPLETKKVTADQKRVPIGTQKGTAPQKKGPIETKKVVAVQASSPKLNGKNKKNIQNKSPPIEQIRPAPEKIAHESVETSPKASKKQKQKQQKTVNGNVETAAKQKVAKAVPPAPVAKKTVEISSIPEDLATKLKKKMQKSNSKQIGQLKTVAKTTAQKPTTVAGAKPKNKNKKK